MLVRNDPADDLVPFRREQLGEHVPAAIVARSLGDTVGHR
jgi:hypothetical protein